MARNPILNSTQLKNRVQEIYSSAIIQRLTSAEIAVRYGKEVLNEVMSSTPSGRRRYDSFTHGFVSGVRDQLVDNLYRYELEYLHVIDGLFYSTSKDSVFPPVDQFYGKGNPSKVSESKIQGHFWKGTTKPFFIVRTS